MPELTADQLEISMDIDEFIKTGIDLDEAEEAVEKTEEEDTAEKADTEAAEGVELENEGEETTDEDSEEEEDEPVAEAPKDEPKREELKKAIAPVWRKPIVAKDGETEVKVPPTATWEVKVDGKVQTPTTQELLTAYSSKAANDRARTEIIQEKRVMAEQTEHFNNIITNFAKKAEEGHAMEAFSELVAATGKDPLKVVRNFRNEVIKTAREYLQLSDEERAQLEVQEENRYLQGKIQQTVEQKAAEVERERLNRDIDLSISNYGLKTREAFKASYEQAKTYVTDQIRQGNMPRDYVITPDFVGRFHQSVSRSVLLDRVLTKTAPTLKNDAEAIERLSQAIIAFNPSEEELEDVVKEFYAEPEAEQVAKAGEKKKTLPPTKPNRKTQASQEDEDDPGLDIDRTPSAKSLWRAK